MPGNLTQLEAFLNQREGSRLTYVFHGQFRMCLPRLQKSAGIYSSIRFKR